MRRQRKQAARPAKPSLASTANRTADPFSTLDPDFRLPQRLIEPKDLSGRRQRNLTQELKLQGRGAKNRLAAKMKFTPGYISHLASDPGTDGHQPITDEAARKLEIAP